MRSISSLALWITTTLALPQVAFPFNSQVPSIARVGESYEFQLSPSTFRSPTGDIQCSLSGAPAWLNLNNSTWTLSGTPAEADVGSLTFMINAADNDGSVDMSVTLVVVKTPAPKTTLDLSETLSHAGRLLGPSVLGLSPSSDFNIQMPNNLFSDPAQKSLLYYATLMDHTPLPAWISFSPSTLGFSGTSPPAALTSQTFDIDLIASDVAGFASASIPFTLVISTHQLAFNATEQNLSVQAGSSFEYTGLLGQLSLDGTPANISQIATASAQKPEWIVFDNSSLVVKGVVPSKERLEESIEVYVHDEYGDRASIVLNLHSDGTSENSTFFAKQQHDLNATIGESFQYDIDPLLFTKTELNVTVNLGSSRPWLIFNDSDLSIQGKIPDTVAPVTATATITARSQPSSASDTEIFHITIASSISSSSHPTILSTSQIHSSSSVAPTSSGWIAASASAQTSKMPFGAIFGLVILFVLILFSVILCIYFTRRRGCRKSGIRSKEISNPILWEGIPSSPHDSRQEQDLERNNDWPMTARAVMPDNPPQISLNISGKHGTAMSGARNSQTSYLDESEGTILSYHERSSWGRAATETHTPHHSMSIPTAIARQSRHSMASTPAHSRGSELLSMNSLSRSRHLSGLGHGRAESEALQWRRRRESSTDFNFIQDMMGSTPTPAPKARTPRRTSSKYSWATHEPRPLTAAHVGRAKSIRMVKRSPSSRAAAISTITASVESDIRPLEIRRQSYIKNRAANRSPFFSTVAMNSSKNSQNPSRTASPILEDASSSFPRNFSSISFQDRQQRPRSRILLSASSSRQFDNASSFYSTSSSNPEFDFSNISTDVSPSGTLRRGHVYSTSAPPIPRKSLKRQPSGKRSAWAAKLGRDYKGQLGTAEPLTGPNESEEISAVGTRENMASKQTWNWGRRSNVSAERRAWERRLPLAPMRDGGSTVGNSPKIGREETGELDGEENSVAGKQVIGLGLSNVDDWETIRGESSGNLGSDGMGAFL
ncbi:MAG: hypothetical protein M1820_004889 [Bogoriella megaspora]|nr:MAG: hypothetical protein M1820_004889 [Bogoriella megaspora]